MALFSKKKINLLLLFLAATAVWSSNIYRLFKNFGVVDSVSSTFDHERINKTHISISDSLGFWMYPKGSRDPFNLPQVKKTNKVVNKKRIVKPEIQKPVLSLTGIILDKNKMVALIETPDGKVHFMSEGDKLDSLYIEKITEKQIIVKYKKNGFTYSM